MMKMMILASRRDGMTQAEFRRYVTEVHGPLVKSVPEVADAIRHYHYNFPIADADDTAFGHPRAAHLDIVTQGWFDSREAQLANMAEPRYLEIVRPDEHRFAGPGALMHYTHEARRYFISAAGAQACRARSSRRRGARAPSTPSREIAVSPRLPRNTFKTIRCPKPIIRTAMRRSSSTSSTRSGCGRRNHSCNYARMR
jgi:hypothetical protein